MCLGMRISGGMSTDIPLCVNVCSCASWRKKKAGGGWVFVSVCACKREIKWPSSSAFV